MNDPSHGYESFYDGMWEKAGEFANYNPSSIFRRSWVVEWSRKLTWSRHLDIGCGTGTVIRDLDTAHGGAFRHTGVDLSAKVCERNALEQPRHTFQPHDIQAAPLPADYDLVTCIEVLEHLPDPERALSHLADSCLPGGHILLTTPTGPIHTTERGFGHLRHFTLAELRAMFAASGFETIHASRWGWPFHDVSRALANIHPRAALSTFATERLSVGARAIYGFWGLLNRLNIPGHGQQLLSVARKVS